MEAFPFSGSVDSAVEALLQRAADGVLAEDRREALADLRDLLSHNAQASCSVIHSGHPIILCANLPAIATSLQAQLAVGAQGLPVLCNIVKEEREDTDMLRAALECLTIAIGNPTQQSESSGKVQWCVAHLLGATKRPILTTCFDCMQGPQPAALNAELFSRGKDNVEVLLGLLNDEPAGVSDFYVRYHTIQLLTALAAVSSYRIQEVLTMVT